MAKCLWSPSPDLRCLGQRFLFPLRPKISALLSSWKTCCSLASLSLCSLLIWRLVWGQRGESPFHFRANFLAMMQLTCCCRYKLEKKEKEKTAKMGTESRKLHDAFRSKHEGQCVGTHTLSSETDTHILIVSQVTATVAWMKNINMTKNKKQNCTCCTAGKE